MKKIDLIHTTILIVAILMAYSALQTIFGLLAVVASLGELYHTEAPVLNRLIYSLFLIAAFTGISVLLIRNARKYAQSILKYDIEGQLDDELKWQLDRSNIILVLFIGFGIYTFLASIPNLVSDAIQWFTSKVDSSIFDKKTFSKSSLLIDLLRLTCGAFLIYGAPNFTKTLEAHINRQIGEVRKHE